jgi:hypothetical protein
MLEKKSEYAQQKRFLAVIGAYCRRPWEIEATRAVAPYSAKADGFI